MAAKDLAIYLGATAKKHHVYAQIRIDPNQNGDAEQEYTDHSVGPGPLDLGIMFNVTTRKFATLHSTPDGYWDRGGQVASEDRVIVKPAIPVELIALIDTAWRDWHLNTMQAQCDHMTSWMLTPSDSALDEYIATHPERSRYGRNSALQSYRLDNVVCPVTGYKYGHKWLSKKVPDEIIEGLKRVQRYAR